MMKVAVVGMLPRQEQLLGVSRFKNLDVRFANKGPKYGLNENAIFNTVDRILVMTKWVSHSLTEKLDRRKTTLIHGGLGKLRDQLELLNTTARLEEQPPARKDPLHYPPANDEKDETMATDKQFDKIKDAKVGDVLQFKRPPHTTLAKWKVQWQVRRSYYKINYGVLTEIEFKDGVANLLITAVEPEKGRVSGKKLAKMPGISKDAKLAELEKRANAETQKAIEDSLAGNVETVGSIAELVDDEPVMAAEYDFTHAVRGPVAGTTKREGGDPQLVQQFWMDVFLQSMRNNPGAGFNQHREMADGALRNFRLNF